MTYSVPETRLPAEKLPPQTSCRPLEGLLKSMVGFSVPSESALQKKVAAAH